MAQVEWTETTPEAVYANNQMYKWLSSIFSAKSHTHYAENIKEYPTSSFFDSNTDDSTTFNQHMVNERIADALESISDSLTVSKSTHSSLTNGSGRVTFFKFGKQVTCDYYVGYTSHSTASAHTNIIDIPSSYLPSDTIYSGVNAPIQNNSDASTYQTRDSYTSVEKVSGTWKLQFFTSLTSTAMNVRGQMVWFTD